MGWFSRRKGPSKAPEEPISPAPTLCIGREDELNFIAQQLNKPSSATLIYGDPSIGKSKLLQGIERTHNKPSKAVYVGLWETGGQEDALLYALANLLDKVHKGPIKDQVSILWSRIKESFSSLESFNNFAKDLMVALDVPGAGLPDFLRKQFGLKLEQMRTPLLNREIFLSVIGKLRENIGNLKIILLLDNLSIGFENQPTPEYVLRAYETLRNVLEKIGEIEGLHLIISWKLTYDTRPSFEKVRDHFLMYGHEVYQLGPIKSGERYKEWLEKDCRSFSALEKDSKDKLLELAGCLPAIGSEWIRQENHSGGLSFPKFKEIAEDVKERKHRYLSSYLNEPGRESQRELVYQLSVLPSMHGLTLHQIAELVPCPSNNMICQCGLKGAEQDSFIKWQTQCQYNLNEAIRLAILKSTGKTLKDSYFFDHETKKDYIRNLALNTPMGQRYLQRAFDFSINHLGFPTEEHPSFLHHLVHTRLLMEQIPNTLRELINTFDAFASAVMTGFEDKDLICMAINSTGFSQLPPHLRAVLLSEGIKFPDKVNIDQNHKDLLETLKGDLTYFQVLTIATALTNATGRYGERGKLNEMGQCLEGSKALYETYKTPEMALEYAKALYNVSIVYKRAGDGRAEETLRQLGDFLKD